MICLTATLTKKSKQNIMKYLALKGKETYTVDRHPLGSDVNLIVMDKNVLFSLETITAYFKLKMDTGRVIVFCRSIEDCALTWRELRFTLGTEIMRVVTAETEKCEKEEVIKDLQQADGKFRLVIATSTLSMGINIKGVEYVVQLGIPTSFEEFLQKCGRVGREGSTGYAIIYPWFKKVHPKTDKSPRKANVG